MDENRERQASEKGEKIPKPFPFQKEVISMTDIQQLKEWLAACKHNIFLGGAGVSTASGIPDFRSAHGLYMSFMIFSAM